MKKACRTIDVDLVRGNENEVDKNTDNIKLSQSQYNYSSAEGASQRLLRKYVSANSLSIDDRSSAKRRTGH